MSDHHIVAVFLDLLPPCQVVEVHPADISIELGLAVRALSVAVCLLGSVLIEHIRAGYSIVVSRSAPERQSLDDLP